MMRDLALRSGARIDYNCNVVDVNVDEASVLLEGGERIHADMVIGADGTTSLVRKVVAGEEAIEKGPYTTYRRVLPYLCIKVQSPASLILCLKLHCACKNYARRSKVILSRKRWHGKCSVRLNSQASKLFM